VCSQPITKARRGHAAVNRKAALERSRAVRVWLRDHPGQDPNDGPPLVRWRLAHATCDKLTDDDFRFRAPHDLSTDRKLLHASLRLNGKHWTSDTDFQALAAFIFRTSGAVAAEGEADG
jgi:hypothetical protein